LTSQAEQFNQRNIDEFRTNHGRVGGTFASAPLLLLHTVGARSGQQLCVPKTSSTSCDQGGGTR
jgi:F420H(2)-dependent quinone reductase